MPVQVLYQLNIIKDIMLSTIALCVPLICTLPNDDIPSKYIGSEVLNDTLPTER